MKLSERLLKITELINDCSVLADIGTDHGYVPIYCVKCGLCKRAIACDINSGPLAAAKENINLYGLTESILTRISDGLEALAADEADTIVISGMGGFLIRDILSAGADRITDRTRLILQPMVAAAELRQFLCRNGYRIITEKLAREEDKFYNIILAQKGSGMCSEKEILIGKNISDDENYIDYIDFHKRVFSKIITGLEKATGKDEEIKKYRKLIEIIG